MNIMDVGKYLSVLVAAVLLFFHFDFMGLIGAVVLALMFESKKDCEHWWHLPS